MGKTDFLALARHIAETSSQSALLPVIEKELLHYGILQALDRGRFLEQLTFQGGTCLRLCFGSPRYSEDLDFVGGTSFCRTDMADIKSAIEQGLVRRYGLSVAVEEPAKKRFAVSEGITVDRWQIKVVTAPNRPDIPQQRISLEIAAVAAHTQAIRALGINYPEVPASFGDILLKTEALEEICADKLKAFVTASNIRYRDLWDLRWIARQPSFSTGSLPVLFQQKITDYHQGHLLEEKLGRVASLPEIVGHPEFIGQMRRFLPADVLERTVERPLFCEHLVEEIQALYRLCLR